MRAFGLGLTAIATLGLATMSSQGKAQETHFQDWVVSCGSDDHCTTSTLDQNGKAGPLSIRRTPERGSNWSVSVATKQDNPSLFGPTTLRVAGQRLIRLSPNRDFATFGQPNEFFFIDTASFSPLFRRMIESRRVFLSFSAAQGKQINASYSLKGLSNALLWIDEQQNKVGSRRTVVAPKIKQIVEAEKKTEDVDAEALAFQKHDQTRDPLICDVSPEQSYSVGTVVETIDDRHSIAIIPCSVAAYNVAYRVFVINRDDKQADLQLWATYSDFTGWIGTDLLSNVAFDKASGQLSMVHKGRGLGDCGVSGTWQWDGSFFKLLDFRSKDECDGKEGEWPSVLSGR